MMDQVPFGLPGAVATYTAKSALFTAGLADRGTFFDNTGSYTISFSAAATLGAGWSCWFRNVSGTQVLDPNASELINGAATYSIANAGDCVLVTCTGAAFVVTHVQRPSSVAISGGTVSGVAMVAVTISGSTINSTPIGTGTAASAAVTTLTSSDTTAASAVGTAAVVFQGGLSVAKQLYTGSGVYITDATLLHSKTTLTDGAGSSAGTLTNAPSIGNPTKWLLVDDNGTVRKVPSWT